MRIGIDLDGVTADIGREIKHRLNLAGVDTSAGFQQFDIAKQFGVTREWIGEQFSDPAFWLNAIPYEDAWTIINKWFSKSQDIFFITCRRESNRPETERWLDEWDIPYNELVMGMDHGQKWVDCKKRDIDFLIEDRDTEIMSALDNGVTAVMMQRDYNAHVDGAITVGSFYEIDGMITNGKL